MTDNRWVTISELANATGMSRETLRSWCRDGKIPASHRGSTKIWYVDLVALRTSKSRGSEELFLDFVRNKF